MGQLLRRENVAAFVDKLHKSGKTVVATNGCFDILGTYKKQNLSQITVLFY